jgi:hypothetical protein
MERIDKIHLAIKKGITYNPLSGEIIGVKGKVLKAKDNQGYIYFGIWENNVTYRLYGHQFAWYSVYGELVNTLDHINRIKTDNRISNLREASRQLNGLNRDSKGYSFDKNSNKFISQIMVDGKNIHLGRYNTSAEAEIAYQQKKFKLISKIVKL